MLFFLLMTFCNNPTDVVCSGDAFFNNPTDVVYPRSDDVFNDHRIDVVSYADDVL